MQKDFDVYPDTKKEFPAGHPTEKNYSFKYVLLTKNWRLLLIRRGKRNKKIQ